MNNAKQIALPPLLRKDLTALRFLHGSEHNYVLQEAGGQMHELDAGQFFILEVLQGFKDFDSLAVAYRDRFGKRLERERLDELFGEIASRNLWDKSAAAQHPLLAASLGGKPAAAAAPTAAAKPAAPAAAAATPEVEIDVDQNLNGWKLFDPRPLLKHLSPIAALAKYGVYLVPLLAIAALFITYNHYQLVQDDIGRLLAGHGAIFHVVFGLLTNNLAATFSRAFIAHSYRAAVGGVSLFFVFGFLPRFGLNIAGLQQLSRREKIWLHAGPLLVRLALSCGGLLLWYGTRVSNGVLPVFGLALATISGLSFLMALNPLAKSNGYYLLTILLNEPSLRGKSAKSMYARFKGTHYSEVDDSAAFAYGLASLLYTVVVTAMILGIAAKWLKFTFSGTGVLFLAIIIGHLASKLYGKLKSLEQAYERSQQVERWRKRNLPPDQKELTSQPRNTFAVYLKRAALVSLVVSLFLPYLYEPGGQFVVLPADKHQISTDVEGVIHEVYFDGGEILKKGDIVARLGTADYEGQVRMATAKIAQQQALVEQLKAKPRPEEIALAESAVEAKKTAAAFDKETFQRLHKSLAKAAVSELAEDEAQRQYEVDLKQMAEARAQLDLVKAGVMAQEIAAAEAELQHWQEQRAYYQDRIERSALRMPMNGRLATLLLKQKLGTHLKAGESFAEAQETGHVLASIEVPETDIGYVKPEAPIRARTWSYYADAFPGHVQHIDSNVSEKPYGRVVNVVTWLDNNSGLLKPGMTGYAKIEGGVMPAWYVFTRAIARFVQVEAWSWLP
jgi:putative peptide zinc metalloprotease protein